MSLPAPLWCAVRALPVFAALLAAPFLPGCASNAADPVAAAVAIAEARCECMRQNAPSVAACVNKAAHSLHGATVAVTDGAVKSAMVRA